MRCLRKFQWIKLFRDNLPEGKGILGFWAKLAACAAYRNGTSLYCGFENEVKAGSWVGGIVGIKSILGLKSRQETIKVLDKLVELGYSCCYYWYCLYFISFDREIFWCRN